VQGTTFTEVYPGPAVQTRDDIAAIVQRDAWGHHACGTCKIGVDSDASAVLDSRLRVRGVTGLRVVDASIFPDAPGFFMATAVYMASEKATDDILEDAGLPRRVARA
jgi:choline dehydrogenase